MLAKTRTCHPRTPWLTRSYWQNRHQYHRQFPASHSLPTGRCSQPNRHYLDEPLVSRSAPIPPTGNWVCFSCSIPRLFVLSHNMPMINSTGKLALFWRFSLTTGSLPSDSLATDHCSFASRLTPHQRGQVVRGPPLRWLLPSTDSRIGESRTGPDLSERVVYIQYVTNRAISSDKSIRFSPLAASRPLTIRSWPEALERQGLQTCRPDAHQPECLFSLCRQRKYSAW